MKTTKKMGLPALVMLFAGAMAQAADGAGDMEIEEIIVTAHPLSAEGLSQDSIVLQGAALERVRANSIGETLGQQPGIHNSSFGKAVGRPVIHGLGGARVRVMEDRIDALDVSVTSADHAVGVDPFVADRVEVLKGPSALLYGSGAIGGVVDVHTGRIPHAVPDEPFSGGIESRYDSNAEGFSTTAKLNGGAGQFAWHLDASIKDGDEYEIPGFAESAALRAAEEAEEAEEEGEEHEEEEEVRGFVPGTDYDADSYAGGFSFVGEWGFAGVSVSRMEANYGLPGGHGHEEEEEEEEEEGHEEEEGTPRLDLEQTRVDLEVGVNAPFGGRFESFNFRFGINDYEHQEIEPSGEVATDFDNEAWEARAELVYRQAAWLGAFGVQISDREFSALGEEAFVPPVDTREFGAFWVAERAFGSNQLELGARIGRVEHEPEAGPDRDFTPWAVSAGVVLPMDNDWQLSLLADAAARAPVGEELYSNGPHLATGSFEIGDDSLDEERVFNLSATLAYNSEQWQASATAYVSRFRDFIFEAATGEEEDELPVFQFGQEDAVFRGLDLELRRNFTDWSTGTAFAALLVDGVRATFDGSGDSDIPRIPPWRVGLELGMQSGDWIAGLRYFRVAEQDDVAPQEFETDDYDDLQAHIEYRREMPGSVFSVFANGRNLTDDEQRLHTSFIKDFAPAPGRSVELGLRLEF